MSREMMSLTDFLTSHGVAADSLEQLNQDLIEKLFSVPPSTENFPKNDYIAQRYIASDKKEFAGIMGSLVTELLTSMRYRGDRADFHKQLSAIYKIDSSPMFLANYPAHGQKAEHYQWQMKVAFLQRAAIFTLFTAGDCSYRSCYSAYQLRKILPEDVTVKVYSFPGRDHVIMKLIDEQGDAYVYDPLTDPEKIFTEAFHKENLTAALVQAPALLDFDLTVTKELHQHFDTIYSPLRDLMNKMVRRGLVDISEEMLLEALIRTAQSKGVKVEHAQVESWQLLLKEARGYLFGIVNQVSVGSASSVGLLPEPRVTTAKVAEASGVSQGVMKKP